MSMTQEEAMKLLSYGDWWNHLEECLSTEEMQQLDDALFVVEKALRPVSREQVERMRGEWIAKHRHRGGFRRVTGVDDMGEQHTITIDERCECDDQYCSKCGKQSPDNFLNFCGYCGQPKTDEAVDMAMEKLEAMKDGNEV